MQIVEALWAKPAPRGSQDEFLTQVGFSRSRCSDGVWYAELGLGIICGGKGQEV